MKVTAWRQVVAVLLSFELGFAPALANARDMLAPPQRPSVSDLTSDRILQEVLGRVALLEHGDLPNFGPDELDPFALEGQYVNLYDVNENIVEQYSLDATTLGRAAPGFSKLTPKLVPNARQEMCLTFEASVGEDANGDHGRVVARMYLPRLCNIAALAWDKEVITLVDTQGRVSVGNYGYIASMIFQGAKIPFHRNDWTPAQTQDFAGRNVTITPLTIGARPIDPNDVMDDALLAYDENGVPTFNAGDMLVRVDGKVFANLNVKTLRTSAKSLMTDILVARLFVNGVSPEQIEMARAQIEEAEKNAQDFTDRLARIEKLKGNPAFALLVDQLTPEQTQQLLFQSKAFSVFEARENDAFNLKEWNELYPQMVEASKILNHGVPYSDEKLRVDWKQVLPKKFQTPEQLKQVLNESWQTKTKRTAISSTPIAIFTAVAAALMAFPIVVESSETLRQFATVNWLYGHSFAVLRDAAYRVPLIPSTFYLSAVLLAPIAASIGMKYVLKGLEKAAAGRNSPVAHRIRDMAGYWADMKDWQRITTFGYKMGAILIISPLIRLVEGVFQQKAFLSAARLQMKPWQVVDKDSEVGQAMKLERNETLGLTVPSIPGMLRKAKRMIPFVVDPGAEAWENRRLEFKQRLQAEAHLDKARKKELASVLALLALAETENIDPAALALLFKDQNFTADALKNLIGNPRAADNLMLANAEIYAQIRDLKLNLANTSLADLIASDAFQGTLGAARDAVKKVKALEGSEFYLAKAAETSKRQGLVIWDNILNQGRDEARKLKSYTASPGVYENVQGMLIPDHMMVVLLPAFVNVPFMDTRADLTNPEQLAAKAGAWLQTNPKHMQDVVFNDGVHVALGTVQQGLQYEAVAAAEEDNYTPREDVANQVYQRDGEGVLSLGLPRAGNSLDHHTGYVKTQGVGTAMKQYMRRGWETMDFGQQMKGSLLSNLSTIFIYAGIQLTARMVLGDQGLHHSVMGLSYVFLASPVYYRWWWWFINPSNTQYKKDMAVAGNLFLYGKRRLDQAKRYAEGSARRTELQTEGTLILSEMWAQRAPKDVDSDYQPGLSLKSIEEQAQYWSDKSDRESPGGLIANPKVAPITNTVGAIGSTGFAIPMLTTATTEAYQTLAQVGKWLVYNTLFFSGGITFLSRKSPARDAVVKGVKTAKATVFAKCQGLLSN